MSVYIKGLEMPKSCFVCQFRIGRFCPFIDGWKNNVEKYEADNRHPFCPLTPVPDHGRLIDADALMKKAFRYPHKDGITPMYVFANDVYNAPTIIPADHADKEDGE